SIRAAWHAVADELVGPAMMKALQDGVSGWLEGDKGRIARLCNLFFTPAHSELYISALRRSVEGRLGDSPGWAKELIRYWLTYPLSEAEALDQKPKELDGRIHSHD